MMDNIECVTINEKKLIQPDELLEGDKLYLRLVILEDCTDRYLKWLNDPHINRYLETRWEKHTFLSMRQFVKDMLEDSSNYLFAIIEKATKLHIGNIKLGSINPHHAYADVSYFIGEKDKWGKGYATEAIQLVTEFGFRQLKLHRLQAGIYAGNIASAVALKKAGYQQDACFTQQLLGTSGWEDHIWYCKIAEFE